LFLSFADPNIDETGNQLYKSNHGPSECCYDYCKNDDGLCSSKCDAIFNSNFDTATINVRNTSNDHNNETKLNKYINNDNHIDNSLIASSSRLFIKLDNGTYVLNDYTRLPDLKDMQCTVLPNVTQSTQHCSPSQSYVAPKTTPKRKSFVDVKSSANSLHSYHHYSSSSMSSYLISKLLMQHYESNNKNNNSSNKNYNYYNNIKAYPQLVNIINCIVAFLMSHWMNLILNFIALRIALLQLATTSWITSTTTLATT
jgi:hypothetical protein